MSPETVVQLERAQRGDERAFAALTDPFRRELHVHCYRMLGSQQDAEDLLQETLIAAWRGLSDFERRSSLRTWLYTIATNRCLNALRASSRRPATVAAPVRGGSGRPGGAAWPGALGAENVSEISWLEPYPDALLSGIADAAPGPEARYETKEAVALAFISGLQHLAPQQRAVLVLRDVLGYRTEETAAMLGSTPAAVTSALQRARGTLESRSVGPGALERVSAAAASAEFVQRFAEAFEADDIDALVTMLTDDVVVSMPPEPLWVTGVEAVEGFLRERHGRRRGPWRFVATTANGGQPAYAFYFPVDGEWRRRGLFVVGVRGEGVSSITRFHDSPRLDAFGVPAGLPAAA